MKRTFADLFERCGVPRDRALPAGVARGAPSVAPPAGRQPGDRAADAGRPQLGLLRALVPRPPDGDRARRGRRSGLPRRGRLHADDAGAPTRRRHLPPGRRRVPRPARLPERLACSARPGLLNAYRAGNVTLANARRHRRRRQQGGLRLRAGDDPVLPRRGAGPARTSRPTLRRDPRDLATCSSISTSSSSRRSSESAATACSSGRRRPRERAAFRARIAARPRELRRPADDRAQPPPDLPRGASAPPTSTSGRSSSRRAESRSCRGGLTRAALRPGSLVVNSSQGGGSKDTWVLRLMLSRVAESLYWTARYVERAELTAASCTSTSTRCSTADQADQGEAVAAAALARRCGRSVSGASRRVHRAGGRPSSCSGAPRTRTRSSRASRAPGRTHAGVRDQISTEMWEELNRLHLFLASVGPRGSIQAPHGCSSASARARKGSRESRGRRFREARPTSSSGSAPARAGRRRPRAILAVECPFLVGARAPDRARRSRG